MIVNTCLEGIIAIAIIILTTPPATHHQCQGNPTNSQRVHFPIGSNQQLAAELTCICTFMDASHRGWALLASCHHHIHASPQAGTDQPGAAIQGSGSRVQPQPFRTTITFTGHSHVPPTHSKAANQAKSTQLYCSARRVVYTSAAAPTGKPSGIAVQLTIKWSRQAFWSSVLLQPRSQTSTHSRNQHCPAKQHHTPPDPIIQQAHQQACCSQHHEQSASRVLLPQLYPSLRSTPHHTTPHVA
jgi:hypothetical protein